MLRSLGDQYPAEPDAPVVVASGELEDAELSAGVEALVLVLAPALVPLPLVPWTLLEVVVLADDDVEVPVLGDEASTHGVSATALTGIWATAVVGLVGVEVGASLEAAEEAVAVLLVLVLEGTRLEQPEGVFELDPAVPEDREGADVPLVVLEGSLRSEAPTAGALAGPPAIGS